MWQWVSRLTSNLSGVSLNPIKRSRWFLEQETVLVGSRNGFERGSTFGLNKLVVGGVTYGRLTVVLLPDIKISLLSTVWFQDQVRAIFYNPSK